MSETVDTVLDWVRTNCLKDKPGFALDAETSFLSTNLLDSLSFLHLVTFLEERYGIKIDEEDMSPENFECARTVAQLVERMHTM